MTGVQEIWKPVDGFAGLYEVSNNGRVRSVDRLVKSKGGANRLAPSILIRPSLDYYGYYFVRLYRNGEGAPKKLHRLVAIAFLENIDNKKCVNHKNAIKTDNRAENLEWCTVQENSNHARINNLIKNSKASIDAMTEAKNKPVLDVQTGVFYTNAKKVAELYKINYGTLGAMLSGNRKNKTQFIYA